MALRAHRADEERIAVRRRLGDEAGPEAAAGARLVLHHDRNAGFRLQVLLQDTPDQIGGAAGRERHHDGDLPLRPNDGAAVLCAGRCRCEEKGRESRVDAAHAKSHLLDCNPMNWINLIADEPANSGYTALRWASLFL